MFPARILCVCDVIFQIWLTLAPYVTGPGTHDFEKPLDILADAFSLEERKEG
jgi:hypothetical protein